MQWIDFSEDAVFAASAQEMVDAMQNTIGDGSGAERYINICAHRVSVSMLFVG